MGDSDRRSMSFSLTPKSRSRSRTASELQKPTNDIPLRPLQETSVTTKVKDGFLIFKKKKRWVSLDKDTLHIYKTPIDPKSLLDIPLVCSAVRANTKDSSSFDIVTSKETYTFTITETSSVAEWVNEIQTVCSNLVLSSIGGSMGDTLLTKTYSTLINREDIIKSTEQAELSEQHYMAMKIANRQENRICADCKAGRPEWASINLGIFICIDCSGIHRSFGSHVSKVRSVKLDNWDDESLENIATIGNAKANEYWEYNIPPELAKPNPLTGKAKKEWLTLKYVKRRFTKDWSPSATPPASPSPSARLDAQLEKIRNEAHDIKKQEYKQIIVKLLQEDEVFRNDVRILLLKDIDLDLLKEQIAEFKNNKQKLSTEDEQGTN